MVFPFDKINASSSVNYSYVRFLNAAPGLSKAKIRVNGADMHNGVNYRDFTAYDKAENGKYKIEIIEHDKVRVYKEVALEAEKIYTLAVSGEKDDFRLCVIEDIKRELNKDLSCVRFVNLLRDTGRVDISINNTKILSDLCYAEHTKYVTVAPKTYVITVNAHDSQHTLLTVPNAHLQHGNHYAGYLIGSTKDAYPLQLLIPIEGATYLKFSGC